MTITITDSTANQAGDTARLIKQLSHSIKTTYALSVDTGGLESQADLLVGILEAISFHLDVSKPEIWALNLPRKSTNGINIDIVSTISSCLTQCNNHLQKIHVLLASRKAQFRVLRSIKKYLPDDETHVTRERLIVLHQSVLNTQLSTFSIVYHILHYLNSGGSTAIVVSASAPRQLRSLNSDIFSNLLSILYHTINNPKYVTVQIPSLLGKPLLRPSKTPILDDHVFEYQDHEPSVSQRDLTASRSPDVYRYTCTIGLLLAVELGDSDLVDYYQRNALDLDFSISDTFGWTLLHYACFYVHTALIDIIVTNALKGNPTYLNATTYTGETALILAVQRINHDEGLELIATLMNMPKCDVNIAAGQPYLTALYYAVIWGNSTNAQHRSMVRLLMDRGAEIRVVYDKIPEKVAEYDFLTSHLYYTETRPQRVSWTCVCGLQLHDEYIEQKPGEIMKLQKWLKDQNEMGILNTRRNGTTSLDPRFMTSSDTDLTSTADSVFMSTNSLPTDVSDQSTPSLSTSVEHTQTTHNQHDTSGTRVADRVRLTRPLYTMPSILYLLLCFPVGFTGLKLHHEQLFSKQPQNDQRLFHLLRKVYDARKQNLSLTSILSLRTVTRVSLSHFLVDLSELIDLKPHTSLCAPPGSDCKCIPPAGRILPAPAADWVCEPVQPHYTPPIGVNYLTHLFQNPTHVNPSSTWVLRQIPKRIAGQLAAGPSGLPIPGWGLAFEEGWDRGRIVRRVFFLIVFGAFVFGILYGVFRKDLQSAFSISGCIISALAIVGAYLGSGGPRGFVRE